MVFSWSARAGCRHLTLSPRVCRNLYGVLGCIPSTSFVDSMPRNDRLLPPECRSIMSTDYMRTLSFDPRPSPPIPTRRSSPQVAFSDDVHQRKSSSSPPEGLRRIATALKLSVLYVRLSIRYVTQTSAAEYYRHQNFSPSRCCRRVRSSAILAR